MGRFVDLARALRQGKASVLKRLHLGRQGGLDERVVVRQQLADLLRAHDGPLTAADTVGLRLVLDQVRLLVKLTRGLEAFRHRAGAHGEVTAVGQRGDGGEHVVSRAALGTVAHVRGKGAAILDGVPHELEGGTRHLVVADEVVRLVNHLVRAVLGVLDEHIVDMRHHTLRVGDREEDVVDIDFVRGTLWCVAKNGYTARHGRTHPISQLRIARSAF